MFIGYVVSYITHTFKLIILMGEYLIFCTNLTKNIISKIYEYQVLKMLFYCIKRKYFEIFFYFNGSKAPNNPPCEVTIKIIF